MSTHDCNDYVRRFPAFGGMEALPSGNVRARYALNGQKDRRTFPCYCAAAVWLDELKDDSLRGRWSPTEMAEMTFETIAARWIRLRKKDGSPRAYRTTVDYTSTLEKHVYPLIGDLKIRRLDGNVDRILSFQDELDAALEDKARTIEKAQKYAKWVLDDAMRKQALRLNPFDDDEVYIPSPTGRREPVDLTEEDIDLLEQGIHPHYAIVIPFTAYTGLRAGEVWALRRSSYNALKKELVVSASVQEQTGKGLVMGTTKTGTSRTISLPDFLVKRINDYLADYPCGADDWLFRTVTGVQVRHSNFMGDYYGPAVTKAKLEKRTRFHDLRHFCAHFHISGGYELSDIKELLGHSSITVTGDIYGGVFKKRREEMAAKANAAYVARKASATNVPRPAVSEG